MKIVLQRVKEARVDVEGRTAKGSVFSSASRRGTERPTPNTWPARRSSCGSSPTPKAR